MSPEVNGNPPPVAKRKKNKKPSSTGPCDFSCSYFPAGLNSYPNLNISDSTYYSILNQEPMSLPVYPAVSQNYSYASYLTNPFLRSSPIDAESNECMSLPVGSIDQNDNSCKRRFSDPGLPNESDSSSNSLESKLIQKLTQQVNSLKESNRRLSREVMEMKMEISMLKQQQTRPFDRDYEPGMLADIIREVRDAARVREDALLARVKHMIEERQLSMNQLQLVSDKNRNNDRIAKLEEQLKNLSVSHNRSEDNLSLPPPSDIEPANTARQVLELEREALALRRELQEARAKKEESDQRLLQLDKRLTHILRRNSNCECSEDGKTTSMDSFSVTTTSSPSQPRVTLSGPVTDL